MDGKFNALRTSSDEGIPGADNQNQKMFRKKGRLSSGFIKKKAYVQISPNGDRENVST